MVAEHMLRHSNPGMGLVQIRRELQGSFEMLYRAFVSGSAKLVHTFRDPDVRIRIAQHFNFLPDMSGFVGSALFEQ